jgi:hypothetical protein
MTVLAFVVTLLAAPATPGLHIRTVPATVAVPSNLIVGRSVCANTTWLLTDGPELIAVSGTRHELVVRPVKGIGLMDRPWGLACLSDGSLWTLATSTVMVRLGAEGVVRERIDLPVPRLVLFAWLDRLLFFSLPVPVATPLLATSLPRERSSIPWPRFLARTAASRSEEIARNLVNCGIGYRRDLPCWFADERRATISNGSNASTLSFAALSERDVDNEAPIWDLAIGGVHSIWLLISTTTAGVRGHKAGGRLVKTDKQGTQLGEMELATPARTILAATDTTCLLLTVTGTLVEVVSQ